MGKCKNNFKKGEGVKVSQTYGQLLTECHEKIRNQLKNSPTIIDVTPLYDYLKIIRKMRPNESKLSFIDELN